MMNNMSNRIFIGILAIHLFVSCSSDNFFEYDNDYELVSEIANSQEYIEFEMALYSYMISSKEETGRVLCSNSEYTLIGNDITSEYKICNEKYNILINRYPAFVGLKGEVKDEILGMAATKCDLLKKLLPSRKITRSSNGNPETQGQRIANIISNSNITMISQIMAFDDIWGGVQQCKKYSVESGGYEFGDDSAIWYMTSNSSSTEWDPRIDMRDALNLIGGSLQGVYHYHPTDTFYSNSNNAAGNGTGDEYAANYIANLYGTDLIVYLFTPNYNWWYIAHPN